MSTAEPSLGQLGRYRLLRRLATGGMADILLGVATGIADFEKLVVLKRILPRYAADAEFVRLFLDEARLAATLQHANIVQVFDIGAEDGVYFFAMEYVLGVDLRRLLAATWARGAAVPLQHAVGIAMEASLGLHHAHEKRGPDGLPLGLVHRDISPSNVLLGLEGAVKIADFGIARATLLRGSRGASGRVMGKAPYMSPEQCRGAEVDRRSDLFSLGTLLYELTTGRNPFLAPSDQEVMRRVSEEDAPSPAAHVPGYPPALAGIVSRAMQRDPSRRYATAEALHLELEAFARASGLTPSRIQLSRYIERTFPEESEGWRQAREAGLSVVEYVTRTLDVEERPQTAPSAAPTTARVARWSGGVRGLLLVGVLLVTAGLVLGATRLIRRAPARAPHAAVRSVPDAAAAAVDAPPARLEASADEGPVARKPPPRERRKPLSHSQRTKRKTGDKRHDDDRLPVLP
jgi:serine/threonine protein kinase